MKILILNQDWFAEEFKELGHEVITVGLPCAKHLDRVVDRPLVHIDRVIQGLPDGFIPDCILIHDNSAPICFSGLEETTIPTIFYSVDTHHHAPLHRYLTNVFDHVFIAQSDYLSFFHEWGQDPEWLPLYASRHVEASSEKEHGAVFVGTLNPKLNPDRVKFFEELQEQVPVLCTTGAFWEIFPKSEIVINQTVKGDLNFRVFEAMMCGSMLLTERSGNGLANLFEDGKHLVTYEKGNVAEAAEKIRYYLAHPDEARSIAKAGRDEILRAHTPMARAKKLLEVLPTVKKKEQKQKFFSMMVNYTCMAKSNGSKEVPERIVYLVSALKAAEYGMMYHEEYDSPISCHLVIAAHDYDKYTMSSKGYDLMMKLQEAYPDEQILNLASIRGALNHGHIERAKIMADTLGVEDLHATYENADKIIRNLIDSV